jgi:hypothetical protein
VPDEGGRARAGGAIERDDAVGGDRLAPALEREGPERGERDQVADEPLSPFADQHVAVARLVLEPCRDVRRVADERGLVVADHHLAGVHRDAQPHAVHRRAELADQLAKGALHPDAGPHGADGVVLGDARHAEGREHAISEELDHLPAVDLDGGGHGAVVALHHAARGLGVEPLLQRHRADQIREHDGHQLACDHLLGGAAGERLATSVAEVRVGLVGGAAGRARCQQ